MKPQTLKALSLVFVMILFSGPVFAGPEQWRHEWPRTDFSKTRINFADIISGGPPKDGIPSIDDPSFTPVSGVTGLGDNEPVITLNINNDVRAYPLRIMMWHEIVNDIVGGMPVTVTYCPLCNSSVVFDRRIDGRVLDFGVSGKLRHSDMVMYDRQTESWWQQFIGKGIVGEMTGKKLKRLPARVMPFGSFKSAFPNAQVLKADKPNARRYGENPYVKYDSATNPFLYRGRYDGPGKPLSYVVAIEQKAWLLDEIRQKGTIEQDDLKISWQAGMNSALDGARIDQGRDIGYVRAQRKTDDGYQDIPYDTTFAFAFMAFHPDGKIYTLIEE